jgi:hypothetical protein
MRYAMILVLLSGCALTPEQRAERDISRHGPYCERLGYERGTTAFASCIENQAIAARMRRGTVCQTFGNITTCN